jgi:NO-binding membrane sensor protein with MHYT domain
VPPIYIFNNNIDNLPLHLASLSQYTSTNVRLDIEFYYDSGLVALSIVVAILGSFTGLVMTTGIHRVPRHEAQLRVILGGIGIGGGVWSMHFIAMLAVQLPIPLSYAVIPTSISALIAVIGTAVALTIVSSHRFGDASLPLSAWGSALAACIISACTAFGGAA